MLTYKLKERTGVKRVLETVEIDPEVWVDITMNVIKAKLLDKLIERWGLEITESQGRYYKRKKK